MLSGLNGFRFTEQMEGSSAPQLRQKISLHTLTIPYITQRNGLQKPPGASVQEHLAHPWCKWWWWHLHQAVDRGERQTAATSLQSHSALYSLPYLKSQKQQQCKGHMIFKGLCNQEAPANPTSSVGSMVKPCLITQGYACVGGCIFT